MPSAIWGLYASDTSPKQVKPEKLCDSCDSCDSRQCQASRLCTGLWLQVESFTVEAHCLMTSPGSPTFTWPTQSIAHGSFLVTSSSSLVKCTHDCYCYPICHTWLYVHLALGDIMQTAEKLRNLGHLRTFISFILFHILIAVSCCFIMFHPFQTTWKRPGNPTKIGRSLLETPPAPRCPARRWHRRGRRSARRGCGARRGGT